MQNFSFYNPVKIIFGRGQIVELANEIPHDSRILIIYGGGSIKANGVYDTVKQTLANHTVFEFGGIEPNPKYETLMRAVEFCRVNEIDFLLAVGGGSVIDGTKFISAAVNYLGDPWEILLDKPAGQTLSFAPKVVQAIPFGTVLTLPAAGSEMNCGAVISRQDSEDKLPFGNPLLFPKFSILDPATTFTLPLKQTANGVIDAFVHTTEQYLTFPADAPLQDRWAEGILSTLIEEGPKAFVKPDDYEARANIMLCSTMALNGLLAMGTPQDWSTHMIGHELTAKYGLDHGQTLAIVLPALLDTKREQKSEKIQQYAKRIWGIKSDNKDELIDKAILKTAEFFNQLGIGTKLSDYDIGAEAIPEILAQLEKHNMTALGERGDISLETVKQILEKAL